MNSALTFTLIMTSFPIELPIMEWQIIFSLTIWGLKRTYQHCKFVGQYIFLKSWGNSSLPITFWTILYHWYNRPIQTLLAVEWILFSQWLPNLSIRAKSIYHGIRQMHRIEIIKLSWHAFLFILFLFLLPYYTGTFDSNKLGFKLNLH